MEVTPITPRDERVSSGVGAKPHGRDTSPTSREESKETTNQTAAETHELPITREVPMDLAVVNLAASLRRSDPSLDAFSASKMAKRLLAPEADTDRAKAQDIKQNDKGQPTDA